MKKLIIYLVIPSTILMGAIWYFSLLITETRKTTNKTLIIPIKEKKRDIKYTTTYDTQYVKEEPIKYITIPDTVAISDTLVKVNTIKMSTKPKFKRVMRKKVDTVYVDRVVVKNIPIQQEVVKYEKSASLQSNVTWIVGIVNTLILTLVGAKKLLEKKSSEKD
jgi:hypothetical protein